LQLTALGGALALFALQAQTGSEQAIPARHDHGSGNCDGKLLIREDGIAFESVGEASHSKSWKYGQIEELERNRSENKIIIDAKDDDDDFTLKLESDVDEQLYETLKDRIVAARPR
jgi:hypothetical protein